MDWLGPVGRLGRGGAGRAEAGAVSVERARAVQSREGCGSCRPEDKADRCRSALRGTVAIWALIGEAILLKGCDGEALDVSGP